MGCAEAMVNGFVVLLSLSRSVRASDVMGVHVCILACRLEYSANNIETTTDRRTCQRHFFFSQTDHKPISLLKKRKRIRVRNNNKSRARELTAW